MPIAPDVYKKIVMAKVYMDENFHESIDLDSISREACLSRYHFHRLFTRIYQRTPHQYLTRKRVEQARQKKQQALQQPRTFIPHCFIETYCPDHPAAANDHSSI